MYVIIASTLLIIVINANLLWLSYQVYSFERELYKVKETLKRIDDEKRNTEKHYNFVERK